MTSSEEARAWATKWLDTVADGSNTMSQRKLTSILLHAGDLETLKAIAEERGIHLLLLEDDQGNELVAASLKPFKVIC